MDTTYVLQACLRKVIDRQHFDKGSDKKDIVPYYKKGELLKMFEANHIYYQQLYSKDDYGIYRDNLLLVRVNCKELEERLLELVDHSVFNVFMKTGDKDF